MKKFIIKNRTKRKYTKKTDQHFSLLFSKTFFNILPLLIMIIVLMTTLVISSPTRMPLSNIHFSFSIPSFSLQNPLPFLQAFGNNGVQLSLAIAGSVTIASATVIAGIETLLRAVMNIIVSFDPTPVINLILSEVQTCIAAITHLFSVMVNLLTLIVGFIFLLVQTIIFNFIHNITIISQFFFIMFITVGKEIVQGSLIVANVVSAFIFISYHFLSMLILAIGDWISSVFVAISTWFNHTMQPIGYLISWPFKIVGAYFMQFKPLTDALGKHMNIALHDMGACFTTFSKTLHALGTSK